MKLIVIKAYLRKQEKSQINNLTLYLKQREKEEQTKLKVSKRKEIIKISAEINEIETKKKEKKRKKINESKSWYKIDKLLTRLTKKKKRGPKSITAEMKKEKLQLTPQKYKGL